MSRTSAVRALAAVMVTAALVGACSSADGGGDATSTTPTTAAPSPSTSSGAATSSRPVAGRSTSVSESPPSEGGPPSLTRSSTSPATSTPSTSTPPRRPAARRSARLPLTAPTGNARQVVTVVTDGPGDTTGTLRRWVRSDTGWRPVGTGVFAYVGSGGVGQASEGSTRTPAGSFTLTQAFGRDGNPGTRLNYFRSTPDDYWMSSPGPRYNTHQRCGSCGYDDGVNERLYGIVPEYRQAVVIDYNTRNSPDGVQAGRGSAFFLHVANGEPTAGCVSIDQGVLVDVMRWLDPSQHPRILIGTR